MDDGEAGKGPPLGCSGITFTTSNLEPDSGRRGEGETPS